MKRFFMHTFIVIFLIILGISSARSVLAQSFQLYDSNDILLEVNPELPGANEQVILSLNSYSFNLNNYYIAWFKDGQQESAGYGNKEYRFTTGNSGDITNISAVIEVGNESFKKDFQFTPSEVDLLWEVIGSYAPPFYKGKVLPVKQSTIKITAIAETQLIAPSDASKLVYYWDNNYKRDASASGFGKQSYTITSDNFNTQEKISVTINDIRENSFAKNTLDINTDEQNIEILFYEIDENRRVLTQRALNNNPLVEKDNIHLSFHPLNMTTNQENFTDLFVQWSINNEQRPPQDFNKQDELNISSGGQTGSLPISVTLESIKNLLQEKTEQINLNFAN